MCLINFIKTIKLIYSSQDKDIKPVTKPNAIIQSIKSVGKSPFANSYLYKIAIYNIKANTIPIHVLIINFPAFSPITNKAAAVAPSKTEHPRYIHYNSGLL